MSEAKASVSLLKAASDQMGNEAEDIITDMGENMRREDDDLTPDLLQALE